MTNLTLNKDLTIAQKMEFIRKLNTLESDAHELIYALIKCYYIEHDKGESLSIPYEGQLNKDKVTFSLLDLPIGLRQLLYKFVSLHNRKLLEDQKIQPPQL